MSFWDRFMDWLVGTPVTTEQTGGATTNDRLRNQFKSGNVDETLLDLKEKFILSPVSNSLAYKARADYHISGYQAMKEGHRPWPHRESTVERFDVLLQKFDIVNFDKADRTVLARVGQGIINEEIPLLLNRLETIGLMKTKPEEERQCVASIKSLLEEAIELLTNQPTTLSQLDFDASVEGVDLEELQFPEISMYENDPVVFKELSVLKADWEEAKQLPLDVEDEYTLEQIVISYLPEALSLYERFHAKSQTSVKKKATQLLIEQVELIHKQVRLLIESFEEENLSMMEIHTEFLKQKTGRENALEKAVMPNVEERA